MGGESDGIVEKLTSKQFSDFILMKIKLRMDDGCPLLRGVPQTYLTFRAGKQSLLFILTHFHLMLLLEVHYPQPLLDGLSSGVTSLSTQKCMQTSYFSSSTENDALADQFIQIN